MWYFLAIFLLRCSVLDLALCIRYILKEIHIKNDNLYFCIIYKIGMLRWIHLKASIPTWHSQNECGRTIFKALIHLGKKKSFPTI